jgi:hypothetical protein
VLACFRCNQRRNRERTAAQPINELRRRCGQLHAVEPPYLHCTSEGPPTGPLPTHPDRPPLEFRADGTSVCRGEEVRWVCPDELGP